MRKLQIGFATRLIDRFYGFAGECHGFFNKLARSGDDFILIQNEANMGRQDESHQYERLAVTQYLPPSKDTGILDKDEKLDDGRKGRS